MYLTIGGRTLIKKMNERTNEQIERTLNSKYTKCLFFSADFFFHPTKTIHIETRIDKKEEQRKTRKN